MTLSEIAELLSDPEMVTELERLVAARAKKKAANKPKASDNVSADDIDASTKTGNRAGYLSATAEDRRTLGGLFEPPTDDYTPGAGLGLDFTGGLSLPDETPNLTPEQAKQLAIFTELRRQFVAKPVKDLTAAERQHREMIAKARSLGREAGGMALPLE